MENNKNTDKHTIMDSDYLIVNYNLLNTIGAEATILLQHFLDIRDNIFDGKPFYQQRHILEQHLPFSKYQIDKAIKLLKEYKLIKIKKAKNSFDNRNYYIILDNNIKKLIEDVEAEKNKTNESENSSNTTEYYTINILGKL